jgi:sulfur relay (sulfurtransferase) DsrC/TusE family protein
MLDPGKNIYVYAGRHIPFDENGHLVNARDWSEDLAHHIAEIDSLAFDDCF